MIFRVNQLRGSWIAQLISGKSELGFDSSSDVYLPVVIDDEFNRFDWKTHVYRSTKADSHLGDWWNSAEHSEWLKLMHTGVPVVVRKGMDWETRTAGPKIGIFQIDAFVANDEFVTFKLVKRLGDCS